MTWTPTTESAKFGHTYRAANSTVVIWPDCDILGVCDTVCSYILKERFRRNFLLPSSEYKSNSKLWRQLSQLIKHNMNILLCLTLWPEFPFGSLVQNFVQNFVPQHKDIKFVRWNISRKCVLVLLLYPQRSISLKNVEKRAWIMRLESFIILAAWWQNLVEDETPWHRTHELNSFGNKVVPVHAVKAYVSVEVQPNQFLSSV